MDRGFYLLFFFGLTMYCQPTIFWIFQTMKIRIYMERNLGKLTDQEDLRRYGTIWRHLNMILTAAEVRSFFPSVERFCSFCVVLSVAGTAFCLIFFPWKKALFFGGFIGLLPYGLLQMRLHERRVNRSIEGFILVQELLNNYQICENNMQNALEKTSQSLQGAPLGKKFYLQLAKGLQNAVTRQEVEEQLSSFRYAFDTVWCNVLATNISFAHLYGIKVESALKDLLLSMAQSRKGIEYGRRENHEARIMLLYLAPVSFLLSIFFACRFFDFTVKKFFAYQLGTSLGLQWFFSMMLCYVVSLLIHGFFAKEKMDI